MAGLSRLVRPMRLAILGSGALGRYYADALKPADPVLVGRTPGPYQIDQEGTRHLSDPRFLTWDDKSQEQFDIVLLVMKWHGLPRATQWLAHHAPEAYLASLMNGMGQEDMLSEVPLLPALGMTTDACTRLDPPEHERGVRVHARGSVVLPRLHDPREQWLAEMTTKQQLEWHWEAPGEVLTRRWHKLIHNSVINPLSAIADVANGELPESPAWELAPRLFAESVQVAHAEGISIPEGLFQNLISLTEATRDNLSSMLQDVRRHRPTEIDAINGYISRQGEKHGIATPAHDAILQQIHALSAD